MGDVANASALWIGSSLVLVVSSVLKAAQIAGYLKLPPVVYEKMLLLIPCCGILFFWGLYDRMRLDRWAVPQWMRATFWVYCVHSIPGGYVIAGMKGAFGKSDVVNVLTMFVAILSVPLLSYSAASLVKRVAPRAYVVLTGGRG